MIQAWARDHDSVFFLTIIQSFLIVANKKSGTYLVGMLGFKRALLQMSLLTNFYLNILTFQMKRNKIKRHKIAHT